MVKVFGWYDNEWGYTARLVDLTRLVGQSSSDATGQVTVFEVRIHGRGGQGVVTAAELLSVAAFLDGHEAQAFPSFGSERMGAPVVSFCRISDAPIRLREPVAHAGRRRRRRRRRCCTTSTCSPGCRRTASC